METESDCSLLHEMFQKALNDSANEFAVSMFSTMIRNDSKLIQEAIQLILDQVKLNNAPKSLRALELLEECMSKSGQDFQLEISKYRFLNELSKLVSKKYMGDKTLKEIKDKIMDCFLLWITQYPEKDKIKSVYDCLKKEGAYKGIYQNNSNSNDIAINCADQRKSDFLDEKNELKLKRLLHSTNKEDLEKANLLIQHLVKQNEKKMERVLKQKAELKQIEETVQVFDQVIDTFVKDKPEDEDSSSLLKDLYDSCVKYKHMVSKMPDIMEDSEKELIRDTIRVNDKLLEVIEKHDNIPSIVNGKLLKLSDCQESVNSKATNLTDQQIDDLLSGSLGQANISESDSILKGNPLDELSEVFAPKINLDCLTPAPINKAHCSDEIIKKNDPDNFKNRSSLETIEDLSEDLFKNLSLSNIERIKTFSKQTSKVSLNELLNTKQKVDDEVNALEKNSYDQILEDQVKLCDISEKKSEDKISISTLSSENKDLLSSQVESAIESNEESVSKLKIKPKINYLSEIEINLDDIEPDNQEPIVLKDSKEGLKVILNFAKNKPIDHTSVIVVSSINQGQLPIDDFKFDAFVNKPCKLRLLERNGCFLSGVKPFRPPSDCLQQIMLIYNPTENPLEITYTFSYREGEDPDPIKESLTSNIPYLK